MEMTFGEEDADAPPLDLLLECVEESYRAIAPRTLVKELDARRRLGAVVRQAHNERERLERGRVWLTASPTAARGG